jgi:hypothetical protein
VSGRPIKVTAVPQRWQRSRSTTGGPLAYSSCASWRAPTGSAQTSWDCCTPRKRFSFSAKGVKGSYDALSQVPLPAIAHVKTDESLGHFVVLYRVKKDAVVIADPARGI